MCGSALALALPEATEAHGCPQFERPCLLMTGDLERLVKASLCLSLTLRRNFEQQLPLEPIQLCLAVNAIPWSIRPAPRAAQAALPLAGPLSHTLPRAGQAEAGPPPAPVARYAAKPWRICAIPSVPCPLLNQRPAPENGPMRQVERDLVLCRQREGCLRPLSRELSFSAV